MKYVAQEEPEGCLVACVAMVAGLSYLEVRHLCARAWDQGIHEVIADDVLGELGFALVRRYHHVPRHNWKRRDWPCPPFAPAHIAYVHATKGAHACAMDADGLVFDPWDRSRKSLHHPDYRAIDHIDGFFKVVP